MAALNHCGRGWVSREDACVAFTAWFGFRRQGGVIERVALSLINGLLRDKRLEKQGPLIRRA